MSVKQPGCQSPLSTWLKPAPTEHQEQCTVVQWAEANQYRWPELWGLHAIPNGGHRHKAVAGKLKDEGVKKGVPDLALPVPRGYYHGLYIEMKKRKNSKLNEPDQVEWQKFLHDHGYCVRQCRGADVAIKELKWYMELGSYRPEGIQ